MGSKNMPTGAKYNTRSPGVKRLMKEACELSEPTEEYFASPLEDNLFEWHFTVRGPPNTEFAGGIYHGRIVLPSKYPMEPPHIILLTPNGRFEVNKKICLSISGFHPETWQPSWSIRTALLALIAFMPTSGLGTLGALDYTPEERQILAKKSKEFICSICGKISGILSSDHAPQLTQTETTLLEQIQFKVDEEKINGQQNGTVKFTVIQNDDNDHEEDVVSIDNKNSSPILCRNLNTIPATNSEFNPWNAVIWGLIAFIVILIVRRIFYYI